MNHPQGKKGWKGFHSRQIHVDIVYTERYVWKKSILNVGYYVNVSNICNKAINHVTIDKWDSHTLFGKA